MNNQPTLEVLRDGSPDYNYMPVPPTFIQAAVAAFKAKLHSSADEGLLQLRMAVFDKVHGTHYRTIRNKLLAEKREEAFISRIGLVRC